MKDNQKAFWITMAIILVVSISSIIISLIASSVEDVYKDDIFRYEEKGTFKIIASQENENLINEIIKPYAYSKGYEIEVEYAGTLDIIQKLNRGEKYDAVWLSNSIWGYMLDDTIKLSESKFTNISPIIFGIKKSKAEELGFIGKTIYTQDIVDAISDGKLKFSMSNPSITNSGASAYLGMLSTLAGNPEVLTKEHLENEELKEKLKTFYTGLERSSGSEDFLEELFLKGDYEAVFTYESSIININKKLESSGKEPLYAIYPVDGVAISDSPLAYIDKKSEYKKEVFKDIQSYILSDEGQALLQRKGKRTWYGGTNTNVDKKVFNPDWGIDTSKYITPLKYPSAEVIKLALNVYQNELRKPVHIVFCLDYSGSMLGSGITGLKSAMDYILTSKATNDLIQFSKKDKIDIIPFSNKAGDAWSTIDGTDTEEILKNINNYPVTGMTALYPASVNALNILKDEDENTYNLSVVLMTDGVANVGTFTDLKNTYDQIKKQIPIYSITFGSADEYELQDIAELTNGKIFDGKSDLVSAFKEVRGYN